MQAEDENSPTGSRATGLDPSVGKMPGPEPDNARGFLVLLEPIKDSLYRYAIRMSWGKDQAGDILQEAVMTAWREFDRFQPGTNFKAWMFRILINSVYRLNKRVVRHAGPQLDEAHQEQHSDVDRESDWFSILETPEKLNDLLDERMVAALDKLGGDERQCLLLRMLEEFTYKEIAAMMEIPVGTAMSHVHRGRIKLRDELSSLAVEHGLIKESA